MCSFVILMSKTKRETFRPELRAVVVNKTDIIYKFAGHLLMASEL